MLVNASLLVLHLTNYTMNWKIWCLKQSKSGLKFHTTYHLRRNYADDGNFKFMIYINLIAVNNKWILQVCKLPNISKLKCKTLLCLSNKSLIIVKDIWNTTVPRYVHIGAHMPFFSSNLLTYPSKCLGLLKCRLFLFLIMLLLNM